MTKISVARILPALIAPIVALGITHPAAAQEPSFAPALPSLSVHRTESHQLPPFQPDGTIFAGLTMVAGANRTLGVAFGGGGPVLRFEIEYAGSSGSRIGAPAVYTMMASLVVQPAASTRRARFYGTFGLGAYGQVFGDKRSSTDNAHAIGGGVTIALAGPLHFRVDYRLFFLRGAVYSNPQRIYAGLTLGF